MKIVSFPTFFALYLYYSRNFGEKNKKVSEKINKYNKKRNKIKST